MTATKQKYIPQIVCCPGSVLREKLEEIEMSVKEFAARCKKTEKTIYDVLQGNSSVTPDMAVRFENVLKIPSHFWLNLQRNYDEYVSAGGAGMLE